MTSSNGNIFRVTGHLCREFTSPRRIPRTKAFDVFFDLRLNKRLSKQWQGWWFETPSCPLWRHCNVNTVKKWNNLFMPKLQRCKSKQKHNENDVTTFPNWGTSDSTTGKNDSPDGNNAPKFMNGVSQCCELLLAVDRRDRDVMGILNLVRGTSSSMHVHHEPSFSHTMVSYIIQRTD